MAPISFMGASNLDLAILYIINFLHWIFTKLLEKLLLKIFAKLDPINLNYFSVKSKRFLVFAPKYKNTPETSSEPRGDAQYCGVFWRSFPADHVVSLVSIEEQVGWYCQQYCRNIARKQSATRLVWVFLSRSRKRVHFLNPITIFLLACCFDPF